MAAVTLLRSFQGTSVSRVFGSHLLTRISPAAPAVQKKSLQLSVVHKGRIYGPAEAQSHSSTGHWKIERVLGIGLVAIIPAAIAYPNPTLDMVLTASVVLHTHWGLQGVFRDYVHGQILPKIIRPTVLVLSILAFGSLCYLNYYDCGLGNAIRMVFSRL